MLCVGGQVEWVEQHEDSLSIILISLVIMDTTGRKLYFFTASSRTSGLPCKCSGMRKSRLTISQVLALMNLSPKNTLGLLQKGFGNKESWATNNFSFYVNKNQHFPPCTELMEKFLVETEETLCEMFTTENISV